MFGIKRLEIALLGFYNALSCCHIGTGGLKIADQLDNNEVRMKLQTEIRRLVDRVVLHFKIQKCVIYYHTLNWLFDSSPLNLSHLLKRTVR